MMTEPDRTPFLTAYGNGPVVVLTETVSDVWTARVTRPAGLPARGSGRSWADAHWDLFNTLITEFVNLDRNRQRLDPARLLRLAELDVLRADGTLDLLASIARRGFPQEVVSGRAAVIQAR